LDALAQMSVPPTALRKLAAAAAVGSALNLTGAAAGPKGFALPVKEEAALEQAAPAPGFLPRAAM